MVGDDAKRTRPRDRKRQIEVAAAQAFAEQGYHAVGMQDIATAVGISAPALYRHFPNKYALFLRTAMMLVHRLIDATDDVDEMPVDSVSDARAALEALLDAVIEVTIELRTTGGIYRWEGRYLDPPDRDALTAEFTRLRRRLQRAHEVYRPGLAEHERRQIALAALSVVASVTAHRTVIAGRTLRVLLKDAAWRVLDADLAPSAPAPAHRAPVAPAVRSDAARREHRRRDQLIDAAIAQFAARGYAETTIEDLAEQVGLTPSGVYRHFTGKSAVLMAACERAAVELERATLTAREQASSPEDALRRLCVAYVAHTFDSLPLMRVYFAELGGLDSDERRRIRALQRAHVADWVALVQAVRPELSGREAAVLVHAGLGVVADQAPLLRTRDSEAAAQLAHVVEVVLGL